MSAIAIVQLYKLLPIEERHQADLMLQELRADRPKLVPHSKQMFDYYVNNEDAMRAYLVEQYNISFPKHTQIVATREHRKP